MIIPFHLSKYHLYATVFPHFTFFSGSAVKKRNIIVVSTKIEQKYTKIAIFSLFVLTNGFSGSTLEKLANIKKGESVK